MCRGSKDRVTITYQFDNKLLPRAASVRYDVNKPNELSSMMASSLKLIEKSLGPAVFIAWKYADASAKHATCPSSYCIESEYYSPTTGRYCGQFVSGLGIAMSALWDVSLVVLALTPLLMGVR